jgi:transposase
MWTPEHRRAHERKALRYPSDLTDEEWALVAPLIPPARRGGRPRDVNVREVLNAVFYLLSTGCQWDALPKDLPPKSTAYDYFSLWLLGPDAATTASGPICPVRTAAGRRAEPTVAILDSQSAKAAQRMARPACKQFPTV